LIRVSQFSHALFFDLLEGFELKDLVIGRLLLRGWVPPVDNLFQIEQHGALEGPKVVLLSFHRLAVLSGEPGLSYWASFNAVFTSILVVRGLLSGIV